MSTTTTSTGPVPPPPAPELPPDLAAGLRRLKLAAIRRAAPEVLQTADQKIAVPPLVGALLKNEQDVSLFEKLVFMNQRNR